MKMVKRSKLDIYNSLLRAIDSYGGKGRITHLSYASNTPLDRTRRYLQFLASKGLLREERNEDGTDYVMTPRGYEFLRAYAVVGALVEPDSGR
ncbi:MAG TPA: winged helix-turn-helix domain-containing protein [Nitrososphaerales archaeon]|jgi:predicted transcriptional regulator|nr:winged helix-turn-helix domain-containing protein [Nitrososphaerales archaeon]